MCYGKFEETNQICAPLKLANQSTLNKARVIEITKTCIVAFMKVRNSLVVWCREKKKYIRWWNIFFKALLNIFC